MANWSIKVTYAGGQYRHDIAAGQWAWDTDCKLDAVNLQAFVRLLNELSNQAGALSWDKIEIKEEA